MTTCFSSAFTRTDLPSDNAQRTELISRASPEWVTRRRHECDTFSKTSGDTLSRKVVGTANTYNSEE
jgi:hypothetical protein